MPCRQVGLHTAGQVRSVLLSAAQQHGCWHTRPQSSRPVRARGGGATLVGSARRLRLVEAGRKARLGCGPGLALSVCGKVPHVALELLGRRRSSAVALEDLGQRRASASQQQIAAIQGLDVPLTGHRGLGQRHRLGPLIHLLDYGLSCCPLVRRCAPWTHTPPGGGGLSIVTPPWARRRRCRGPRPRGPRRACSPRPTHCAPGARRRRPPACGAPGRRGCPGSWSAPRTPGPTRA